MIVFRRDAALPGAAPAFPAETWIAGGVLAATACAIAALYTQPPMFALLAVFSLAAGLAFYEPRLLGPLLALALPLEITKLAFPFLETRAELGGGLPPTSVVDAGRLMVLLAFAVWLLRPGRARADIVPSSPLALPLALLFAVYSLSTLYAVDVTAARVESLRLLYSLGAFALIPFFVRDRASLRWTLGAVVVMAALLAAAGVYQQVTGDFFWNEGLGRFGERRINTTFADPNHFARYLLVALVAALVLWFFVPRRVKFAVLLPSMALAILTLVFTGSRGAWLTGLVALPATVLLLPVERSLRLRMLGMGGALLVVAALVIAAFNPYFARRVDTFKFGFEAAGARPYLVEAGLQMFEDHPLTGVGAGGYQRAFEDDYFRYKDPKIKANVTISHTSLVTMVAELGALGLLALAFLTMRWLLYVRGVIDSGDREMRAVTSGLAMVTGLILLGSQTEGRFLEDPYLWLAAGLVVAAEAIIVAERRRTLALAEPDAAAAEDGP